MGKVDQFFVRLDHSVNYAGHRLSGAVVVVLNEPMQIQRVTISFCGRSNVYWEEQERSSRRKGFENVSYSDEEIYFDDVLLLWGQNLNEDSDSFPILSSGRHFLRFEYTTASSSPTSFEGDHGFIRYMCTATVRIPWDRDYRAKLPFSLVGIQDLNVDPEAATGTKTCKIEPSVKNVDIPRGHSEQWTGSAEQSLKIPPCPPMLLHCFIIDVNYELQLEVVRTAPAKNLDLRTPITIGTIPLEENFELIRKDSQKQLADLISPMDNVKATYPDLPDPAVRNCVFGEIDIADDIETDSEFTMGPSRFAPQYAFYSKSTD